MNIGNKLVGIMSMPRLAFTENVIPLMHTVKNLGINVASFGGAFWSQSLTQGMEWAIKHEYEYMLVIDYDTVFKADDVYALYELICIEDADAIIPVQMGRTNKTLFGIKDATQITDKDFNEPLLPVDSGNFGLTILRCSAFANLKKPWFFATPDSEGGWDVNKGKVDDDINFWFNWKESGNSLYLAPQVVVGHLQQMLLFPDRELQPVTMTLHEYYQKGKPENCWGVIPGSEYLVDMEGKPLDIESLTKEVITNE